jgi:multiple sugar transport system permease protein
MALGASGMAGSRRALPRERRWRWQRGAVRVLVYATLILGSAMFSIPLLWMVGTSLKAPWALSLRPPQWIPNPVNWVNYAEMWRMLPFWLFTRNTIWITFANVLLTLLSCTLVGYGFARLDFPGRGFWFVILLATMMLPYQVTMIPVFMIFRQLNWINTYNPLIVPAAFGSAFFIFLLRQFFMTVPRDLDDAATVDGCDRISMLWRIHVFLIKPALAAMVVFSFIDSWNSFMGPLIYLTDTKKMTLAVGLNLFRGQNYTQTHYLMAASTYTLAPVLVVFFVAQKYFIQGITLTGIKG